MLRGLVCGIALALVGTACGNDSRVDDDDGGDVPDAPAIDARPPDAAPDAAFELPLTAADTWTYVQIPGTTCGNGSMAGIGINRSTTSNDLFIYFQGGGACFNEATCYTSPTAVHVDEDYTAATFAADFGNPVVNHNEVGNPLARATWIFVPYCTGDLHAGSRTATYGTHQLHHTGSTNTQTFLNLIKQRYPTAPTLYIAGSSAGGYGATLNFHKFGQLWDTSMRHLLQDSSPFVPITANYATMQTAWGFVLPPNCTNCTTSFPAIMDTVAAANPDSRIGLWTYDDDATIKAFFGYAATAGALVPASNALLDNQYDLPNTKAFMVAGTLHTMLGRVPVPVGANGVDRDEWTVTWLTGTGFVTVRP